MVLPYLMLFAGFDSLEAGIRVCFIRLLHVKYQNGRMVVLQAHDCSWMHQVSEPLGVSKGDTCLGLHQA